MSIFLWNAKTCMYLSIGSAPNDQIFKHQMQSHIKQRLDLFTDNGQLQKISILYHGRLLGFPKGRGGSRLWNSEGMGGYLRFEIRRHGGIPQVGFLK